MKAILFIPSFLFFLFVLYKIVKDDHVFLRKNIKPEQIFDVVFIATIIGILFAQITYDKNSLSLPQGVFGSAFSLLLLGRYKKFPLERIFDFFTLSFISSLPVLFLMAALFYKRTELILYLIEAFFYFILAILFTKNFLPRIMNRTYKEGNLSIYIFVLFSLFSLLISVFSAIKERFNFLNVENIFLIILLIFSGILFVKQKLTKI